MKINKKKEPETVEEITKRYGEVHAQYDQLGKEKEELRSKFFKSIQFKEEDLARQSVWYEGRNPEAYIAATYPAWEIIKLVGTGDGEWKIVIREKSEVKPFVFVNPKDGLVYQRGLAESAPQPNLEKIREFDYKLYKRITFQPIPPRELRPLNEISNEDWDAIQDFLDPAKLTPRMEKPRKAKPEEMNE
jgi:hypothetical protein